MLLLHMESGHCGKVNKSKKHNIQCPMPFLHYNIKLDRKSTACWRCHENLGDYTQNSLLEVWHGDKWQDFRRQHLAGEKPAGCKSCWQMEEKGLESTRTVVLEEFADQILELEQMDLEQLLRPAFPEDIEIRFGNLCNLQCRHCNPAYSSQWMKQLKTSDNYQEVVSFVEDVNSRQSLTALPQHTVEDLESLAPGLKYIKITGGEPLMHPLHYKMLKALEGYEHNITLEYNTNLHYLGLGDQSVIDYWKKFKHVVCRVSIDADAKGYAYMRAHGDLDVLRKNWSTVEQEFRDRILDGTFDLHATCTVNVLNITRIPQVLDLFSELGSKLHISLVQYPLIMDICNLPQWQKDEIIIVCRKLIEDQPTRQYTHWRFSDSNSRRYRDLVEYNVKNLKKIIGWLERGSNAEFEKNFTRWMKLQDQMNNNNLFDYYPEFEYLRPYYV